MNLHFTISKGPEQDFFQKMTGPARRTELHRAMIGDCQHLTEDHLRRLAAIRHATANRLGATPSNHLAQAAEKVALGSAITANAEEGVLTINHPGMGRAMHDVTIKPTTGKYLAIPLNALAYARRPREIFEQQHLFIISQGGRLVICKPGPGKTAIAMYLLVRSVTQKQDRSLLPSDAEYNATANRTANRFFADITAKFNQAAN